jgi:3-oxoacid CoA-transferase subunit A
MYVDVVSQAGVDQSTEIWLDSIEDRLAYRRWYCGHYHTDRTVGKIRFMFNDFVAL